MKSPRLRFGACIQRGFGWNRLLVLSRWLLVSLFASGILCLQSAGAAGKHLGKPLSETLGRVASSVNITRLLPLVPATEGSVCTPSCPRASPRSAFFCTSLEVFIVDSCCALKSSTSSLVAFSNFTWGEWWPSSFWWLCCVFMCFNGINVYYTETRTLSP